MMKKQIFSVAVLLAALTFAGTASSQKISHEKHPANSKSRYLYVNDDSAQNDGIQIINYRDSQQYDIKMKDDQLVSLTIDHKQIPSSEFSKYNAKIQAIMQKVKKDREMAELDKKAAEK